MRPEHKTWIVFPGGTKFGTGRARLLRLVDDRGSLNQAVQEMGMSYRAAWGYLRELEAAAGFALLERQGSGPAGGMRLTDRGRDFVERFDRFHADLSASRERHFDASFDDFPQD